MSVLTIRQDGPVAFLSFNRPEKRNAINDAVIDALEQYFAAVPESVRAIVLSGEGGHFSAGLDLSEHVARTPEAVIAHSGNWHRVTGMMLNGRVPAVAALSGAVMGGGGSVRLSAIIGGDRMTEMMLTGRTYSAEEAGTVGIAHHVTPAGGALAKAAELAASIATNSRTINAMVISEVARIARMAPDEGLRAESRAAAASQSGPDAEEGLKAFLEKRKPVFR